MVHLQGKGSAPVQAIALHGWFGDGASFAAALGLVLDPERIATAFLDYRGYGSAKASSGPYTLEAIARDALVAADELGWERFALIGHSMGGKAALKLATLAPERVSALVGVTPVWAAAAPFDPETLAFFRSAAQSIDARTAIIDNTTGQRLPSHWVRRLAEDSLETSTTEAFAAYLEAWALEDFASDVAGLDFPVQVIAGAHDAGVPVDWVKASWLAAFPTARLDVLPDAGHYPMEEAPARLGSLITAFLDPDGARQGGR